MSVKTSREVKAKSECPSEVLLNDGQTGTSRLNEAEGY